MIDRLCNTLPLSHHLHTKKKKTDLRLSNSIDEVCRHFLPHDTIEKYTEKSQVQVSALISQLTEILDSCLLSIFSIRKENPSFKNFIPIEKFDTLTPYEILF